MEKEVDLTNNEVIDLLKQILSNLDIKREKKLQIKNNII